jgi:hypothetical protein
VVEEAERAGGGTLAVVIIIAAADTVAVKAVAHGRHLHELDATTGVARAGVH